MASGKTVGTISDPFFYSFDQYDSDRIQMSDSELDVSHGRRDSVLSENSAGHVQKPK
jgi:hypothetical protein